MTMAVLVRPWQPSQVLSGYRATYKIKNLDKQITIYYILHDSSALAQKMIGVKKAMSRKFIWHIVKYYWPK